MSSKPQRSILLLALGLLLAAPALSGQGSDALQMTRIDRNPVTSALAGSGSASLRNTAYSAFSNASVLPFYDGRMDAAVSYRQWAPSDAPHIQAGVAFKVAPRFGLSLGYAYQGGKALEALDAYGQPAGSYSPKDHLVALGIGLGLGERFGVGVNLRYALQAISASDRYSGFSGDIFAMYEPGNWLRLTAGLSTLGNRVASSDGRVFKQPASARAGVCWTLPFADAHILSLTADGDWFFSGDYGAAAGLEYAWNETVFVRGGYRYASSGCVIPSHAALGLGLSFAGFRVDVSYLTASEILGNTWSAGLGFRF